jgi:HlyD family secretion protein
MRTDKKTIIPVLLLIVLLGVGVFLWLREGREESSDSIFLSGNIELTTMNLAFTVAGRLIELNVEEGDPVQKGMIIARLEQQQLIHQREQASATLASSRSRLAELEAFLEYQTESVEAQIEQRRAELMQTQATLDELLSGSREQEVAEARAILERVQSEYERARRDWERAETLYEKEDISTSQHDQFKTAFESARASVRQSEERLALLIEGPRQEDIQGARAQVARAQAGLKLAESLRLEVKRNRQAIETAKAEVQGAQARVELIDAQLEEMVAVSPIEGVVLVKAAEVGEVLAAGVPVVEIGDLDHPWLRGYIGEKDLGRVQLGAPVKITTDSFPGKVYPGRISFISSEAEFTPKQIQTSSERVKLVYRIKIEVSNPQHELKLNMPSDAEIILTETAAGEETM